MAGGVDAYQRYEFPLFFPLHRSPQVMDKLNDMMANIAIYCHWPHYFRIYWNAAAT